MDFVAAEGVVTFVITGAGDLAEGVITFVTTGGAGLAEAAATFVTTGAGDLAEGAASFLITGGVNFTLVGACAGGAFFKTAGDSSCFTEGVFSRTVSFFCAASPPLASRHTASKRGVFLCIK